MAEIQARLQPPIFFRQVEDGGRRVKVIWVSPDDKPGESEVGASSNIKQLLDEVEHDIMNYQTEVCVICRSRRLRQIIHTRGFDNSLFYYTFFGIFFRN